MSGKVYLVGAGPGDPGLLTLKGRQLIEEADILIYDALVSSVFLRFTKIKCEKIFVGKRGGQPSISQEKIDDLLIEKVKEGKKIVRLKGGDPFMFGRGGEEAILLAQAGIDWEVVPGVTSAIAAPAYAGIPLTQRNLTSMVTFLTGHEDPEKESSNIDWPSLGQQTGTLVFLMGISNLESITTKLIQHGRSAQTPCAVIMWGTLPRQKTVVGNLKNILMKVKESGIASPSIFIIGDVVHLREQLQWVEKKPLFGKRILVTRSREQASTMVELLEQLGAEPIEFPSFRLASPEKWEDVDQAICDISKFDWIVFTSVNGVKIFFERLWALGKDIRDLKGIRIATIGEMTRQAIEDKMLKVDLSPAKFVSEALLEAFKNQGPLQGKKFLLPRADQARLILPEGLRKEGAQVTELALYRILPDISDDKQTLVQEILEKPVDWVTFASSSTVKNFVEGFGDHLKKLKGTFKIASIGPITSRAVRELGLAVDVEAQIHTIPGLIEALVQYQIENKNTNHPMPIIK